MTCATRPPPHTHTHTRTQTCTRTRARARGGTEAASRRRVGSVRCRAAAERGWGANPSALAGTCAVRANGRIVCAALQTDRSASRSSLRAVFAIADAACDALRARRSPTESPSRRASQGKAQRRRTRANRPAETALGARPAARARGRRRSSFCSEARPEIGTHFGTAPDARVDAGPAVTASMQPPPRWDEVGAT